MSTFSFDAKAKNLPLATNELLGPGLTARSVYSLVRAQEQSLLAAGLSDKDVRMINIRILGWMMIFSSNDEMRAEMAIAIASCNNELDQLVILGRFYRDHWIRTFKKSKGHTPRESGHTSRPSFDTIALCVEHTLDPAPTSYQAAKQNALIRDGYRCMVTGIYEDNSYAKIDELRKEIDASHSAIGTVQCAHIFSRSTNTNLGDDVKRAYAGAAWTVLARFGYTDFLEELNGTNIHRLSNLLTLDTNVHGWFDKLWLWFEPLDDDPDSHRYRALIPCRCLTNVTSLCMLRVPKLPICQELQRS
ncbi:hypothetical protein HGRIS_011179 [Hohenbuehelia grisea]|uniref:HNH nuclease domain-containing protein n=1 Tax=Hohenbuehelia grisea TaxID=104357 RepID=A0ABR3JV45_9AGAR